VEYSYCSGMADGDKYANNIYLYLAHVPNIELAEEHFVRLCKRGSFSQDDLRFYRGRISLG
jgi:hypothetical protein